MPRTEAFTLPSQRIEPYSDIEIRIQTSLAFLKSTQDNYPKLSAISHKYGIPGWWLRARLRGVQFKQDRPGANHKLSDDQESAVCQYLDRLDSVGTSAHLQIVSGCANAILQYAYSGREPAPTVSHHWTN